VHVAGGRPSNIGTRFHNFLYAELGLDFVYKAFTTTDLAAAIAGIRALGIRGCGVSMPFKEACIEFVDAMDASAEAIGSVNTIVNTGGQLRAYNTDYLAIAKLLADHQVPLNHTFAVLGSGVSMRLWWRRCATRGPRGCRGGAQRPDGSGSGRPVRLCLAGRSWLQPATAADQRDPGRDVG
jgi:hypothetical protein